MSTMVHTCSAATISWIDPRLNLPKTDRESAPGAVISRTQLVGGTLGRFVNFIEAFVRVEESRIIAFGFTDNRPEAGLYTSRSWLNSRSQRFPVKRLSHPTGEAACFTQIAGARTEAPEVAGLAAGGSLGVMGGPAGVIAGSAVGRATASTVFGLSPIWSEIEITISVNGSASVRLKRHSLFPCVGLYQQGSSHDSYRLTHCYGHPLYERWRTEGWGVGNPWGYQHSAAAGMI
jgi:hypothetical protein